MKLKMKKQKGNKKAHSDKIKKKHLATRMPHAGFLYICDRFMMLRRNP